MNFAERLTALYFRLNGFFLMPEFSTFRVGLEKGHAHVDLIAFRPAGSREIFDGIPFPLDAQLFRALTELVKDPFRKNIAAVCEVRTNAEGKLPEKQRQQYAATMCGDVQVIAMCCDRSLDGIERVAKQAAVRIGLTHAFRWIGARIAWLNYKGVPKSESWNWSEPALADFLVIDSIQPACAKWSEDMFIWPPNCNPPK